MESLKYSLIIPVYKNEASLLRLFEALEAINIRLNRALEILFVVDGSPDNSYEIIHKALNTFSYPAQLIAHSRNFGSLSAIRTGLKYARGRYFSVMAADLQEPPDLIIAIFEALDKNECEVAIGNRIARKDPFFTRLTSSIFWGLYRKLVVRDMPEGGVDVFGCNQTFKDQLLLLQEARSSLIVLIFWLGFRRKFINFERQQRMEGKSAWTLSKKMDYMLDSVFAFTDLPIRLLIKLGALGCVVSIVFAMVVFISGILGLIHVPGYAPTMILISFMGALNLFGLGLVGTYSWRGYENSKQRPLAVILSKVDNKYLTTNKKT